MKKLIITLSLTLLLTNAYAVNSTTGKVTSVTVHLDDWTTLDYSDKKIAVIDVDGLPFACGTSYKRVTISKDNPTFDEVVESAKVALLTGRDVIVNYNAICSIRAGAFDLLLFTLK